MITSPKVDDFIAKNAAWIKELEFIRQILLETSLEEHLKWGMPTYVHQGKNVVGIGAFKNHLSLWFFQGVFLKDKANKLTNAQEGKTKAMRHWKFYNLAALKKEQKLIKTYVLESMKNVEEGKEVKAERNAIVRMPKELKAFLEAEELKTAFARLTPGQRKEYYHFITEAKLTATKLRRLEKIKPLIQAGKGLNDQYRK